MTHWYARKHTREKMLVLCFLAPSLLLYRLIPMGWNLVLSFQSWSPMRPAR
jgi:ABC-type sugar transport system permease subunit